MVTLDNLVDVLSYCYHAASHNGTFLQVFDVDIARGCLQMDDTSNILDIKHLGYRLLQIQYLSIVKYYIQQPYIFQSS